MRAGPVSALRGFLATEAAGGYVLVAAAAAALVVANSALAADYFAALGAHVGRLSVLHWINDGVMPLFFLLVGLELKRELRDGQLATAARRILPGTAALAGMAVPALIYLAATHGDPAAARGWAVPAATDIAFALAVLALLGDRVPPSLKIFLTAVAIVDDLGAIVIIAVFFTTGLDAKMLLYAGLGLAVLATLNVYRVRNLAPYLLVGAGVWYATLLSGVHATLAGVAVAMTIPMDATSTVLDETRSPLHQLEHVLHPVVAFGVVPVFGFANAGLSLAGLAPATLFEPAPLGILLGLFVGKQAGVFGAVWALCRAGIVDMPVDASWRQIYGVAMLCGIGFTMSLFIAGLAFGDGGHHAESAKLGIIAASLLATAAAWFTLSRRTGDRPA